jgi:hypothetical protein
MRGNVEDNSLLEHYKNLEKQIANNVLFMKESKKRHKVAIRGMVIQNIKSLIEAYDLDEINNNSFFDEICNQINFLLEHTSND